MPSYQSAEALLADADLRLDGIGRSNGVIVVEGPDDKRLIGSHTLLRQQVICAGGRRLVLAAQELAASKVRHEFVFLTDCDYEVVLHRLSPAPNLVITQHADVEADLVALGGIRRLVAELVPAALESEGELERISSAVMDRSVALAAPLGGLRKIALEHGFEVDPDQVRFSKFRPRGSAQVDSNKLVRSVVQGTGCPLGTEDCVTLVASEPGGFSGCNGHDLVRAVNEVLRTDFGVRGQTPHSLESLLRHGLQRGTFLEWSVAKRLRRWEERTGMKLLAPE